MPSEQPTDSDLGLWAMALLIFGFTAGLSISEGNLLVVIASVFGVTISFSALIKEATHGNGTSNQ